MISLRNATVMRAGTLLILGMRNPTILAGDSVVVATATSAASEHEGHEYGEVDCDGFHIIPTAARTCRFVAKLYELLINGKLSHCHMHIEFSSS